MKRKPKVKMKGIQGEGYSQGMGRGKGRGRARKGKKPNHKDIQGWRQLEVKEEPLTMEISYG